MSGFSQETDKQDPGILMHSYWQEEKMQEDCRTDGDFTCQERLVPCSGARSRSVQSVPIPPWHDLHPVPGSLSWSPQNQSTGGGRETHADQNWLFLVQELELNQIKSQPVYLILE